MLDFQLAEIYGYETKRFNEQVKNNIQKFPARFRFQLSKDEVDMIQRSKKSSSGIWAAGKGGRSYLPFAFTEQGIYMLMTVLKGDLATRQSIALIDAFKEMKDFIVENNGLLVNTNPYLESRFASYDKRFEIIEHKIDSIMDNFVDESNYKHFIILDGEKIEADVAYQNIYKKARNALTGAFVMDSGLSVVFKRNDAKFHDRYIVTDYKMPTEKVYHCGCSSKDAGSRITAISAVNDADGYYEAFDDVLARPSYFLE
ncbi:MAG: ORF6N domain-containing protein [Clostridia bacterium]|nr:ORF6N domain-containing protein [Clostridia bacterium]